LVRERPRFAGKSMDDTQNGQTHDEEEDFGTGTIKVNRTKDTAPSLRYIKSTLSKLWSVFTYLILFFPPTVVKEQLGKLQSGIFLIDQRAQELSELLQGLLKSPPPRMVDLICLKVQKHQYVQLIEKLSGSHHGLDLKILSIREILRVNVGE
jgi:hypothetical protein